MDFGLNCARGVAGGRRSRRKLAVAAAAAVVTASTAVLGLATPASAATTTLTPAKDAYVDSDRPTSNYGSRDDLRVDGSPTKRAYMTFDASAFAGSSSAVLRLRANSNHRVGVDVRLASDDWSESSLTYATSTEPGAVIGSTGALVSGNWYAVDLSSAFAADADGIFAIAITPASSTAASLSSRESSYAPELIVEEATAPPPPPPPPVEEEPGVRFLVTPVEGGYQAASDTGTVHVGTLKAVVEGAVGDLGTNGGTIEFGAGLFDLGGEWFELYDIVGITFAGQGIDVTILKNWSDASTDTEPFDISTAHRLTIRDLTVDAGGPNRSTSDAIDVDGGNDSVIERVKVTDSRGRGIVFDGKDDNRSAERNTIRDCVVTGVPSDGIELLAASQNRIEGCFVKNPGGHGIQLTKSSSSSDQPHKKSSDNVITRNTIDNSGLDGVNVNAGDRNSFTDNVITNSSDETSGRDGIRLSTGDGQSCNDNVVRGNKATDTQSTKTQRYGLNISSSLCNRTVVSANDFAGNRTGPIRDSGTGTIYS